MPLSEKFTVTVGIPAHNEEQNIRQLLSSVVSQKGDFILEKIIVVCDGCTDGTEAIVKEFAATHPAVECVSDGKRKGKSERLNFLYKTHTSDALITLDADIELADVRVFEKLLEPLRDPQVVVVAGNARPLPGRTFVEKLVVAKDAWWYEARKNFKNGNNIYSSSGGCFALAKEFTKCFQFFFGSVNDQEIIYLQALHQGKQYVFADDALVRYREASTWKELISRAKRFEHRDDLKTYGFTADVETEYAMPAKDKISALLKIIRLNPFYGTGALLLAVILKFVASVPVKSGNDNPALWDIIVSTKKLHDKANSMTDAYTSKIIRDLNKSQENEWETLWGKSNERHFFNSPKFFHACREAFKIKQYAIVFIYRNGSLCAVLPLAMGKVFGISCFMTPGSDIGFVDKSSLLVDQYSQELIKALLSATLSLGSVYLAEGNEQVNALFQKNKSFLFTNWASRSPFLILPQTSDILQNMSADQKRNLRSRLRHNEKHMTFRMEGIEALQKVMDVEHNSYRPRYRMAYFRRIQAASFLRSIAKQVSDSIVIGVLYFHNQPIATVLGFKNNQTFYWYHTAYSEKFGYLGPGKIALYLTLRYLHDKGFTTFDLLRGDSSYKRQFAANTYNQYDTYLSSSQMVLAWWKGCTRLWKLGNKAHNQLRSVMSFFYPSLNKSPIHRFFRAIKTGIFSLRENLMQAKTAHRK